MKLKKISYSFFILFFFTNTCGAFFSWGARQKLNEQFYELKSDLSNAIHHKNTSLAQATRSKISAHFSQIISKSRFIPFSERQKIFETITQLMYTPLKNSLSKMLADQLLLSTENLSNDEKRIGSVNTINTFEHDVAITILQLDEKKREQLFALTSGLKNYLPTTLAPSLGEWLGSFNTPLLRHFAREAIPVVITIGFLAYAAHQKGLIDISTFRLARNQKQKEQGEFEKVSFDDIAGIDEQKDKIQEIIDMKTNPKSFEKFKAKLPKGVLLAGPPGVGKTMIARAFATESKFRFFPVSASEFQQKYIGEGPRILRELFDLAEKNAPAVIFIDEIDAIGKRQEGERTNPIVQQLLTLMDGFKKAENILILAATNAPENLDPALLRSGRFDRKIFFTLPDQKSRKAILDVYINKIPDKVKDIKEKTVESIAKQTNNFSGSDLAGLINMAKILAGKEQRQNPNKNIKINGNHLNLALKDMVLQKEELEKRKKEHGKQFPFFQSIKKQLQQQYA